MDFCSFFVPVFGQCLFSAFSVLPYDRFKSFRPKIILVIVYRFNLAKVLYEAVNTRLKLHGQEIQKLLRTT